MLATPLEPLAGNSPFLNPRRLPSGSHGWGWKNAVGRALPGLWVAGKWVTFAEGSPQQQRRAGATAACLGELHAVLAGNQVVLLTPPPRGPSPATHSPS